jgi:hypothetical protein
VRDLLGRSLLRGIVPRDFMKGTPALTLILVSIAAEAGAWPAEAILAMIRDARRLVPRSLSRLIADRESLILEETQRFPEPLARAVAQDLSSGAFQPETLAALEAHAAGAADLLRHQQVSEGVVRLGATLRIPADLSDPALTGGPEGYPAGVVREYYAFLGANLDKIPVVLDDPKALTLSSRDLPAYWESLLHRSQDQAGIIRSELFQKGRLVDHHALDYRSPLFSVASLSYSRAVTAIAATWLALWRQAHGDVTRMRPPREIDPRDTGPVESPQPHEARP